MNTIENNTANNETYELKQRWDALLVENPKLRIRNAANELGVKEVQLLALDLGNSVKKITGDWVQFLKEMPQLGRVMSLTRNESCVMEHKGEIEKVDGNIQAITIIGPIETRAFVVKWQYGFAVETHTKNGVQRSFQFFDKFGDAVTKFFLQPESNLDAYQSLVDKYLDIQQEFVGYELAHEIAQKYTELAHPLDLINDWSNLKDTHEFFGLMRKYNISRIMAIKAAEGIFTRKVDKNALEGLLRELSENLVPIMVFVANSANIQIHQDYIHKVVMMGNWLNILDKDFNLHLDLDGVADMFWVNKPTSDGNVHSLELYAQNGDLIVQFFGLRKPGKPELKAWTEAINALV